LEKAEVFFTQILSFPGFTGLVQLIHRIPKSSDWTPESPTELVWCGDRIPELFFLVPSHFTGWHVSDFIKFEGEGSRTTWEHMSQYLAQLGEASSIEALCVRLFSLSLTGTTFA
jgi:hypothetical protein